ncbi:MAG: acyl carrier protein [Firmicutes bacterium]|nr:acyl carrier protein [Bacillota bacterium]
MDKVREILENIRPDVDFETETGLIDDGVLDSFDIIAIVTDLNEEFDIEINVNDLVPENFNSMEAIYELVTKLLLP